MKKIPSIIPAAIAMLGAAVAQAAPPVLPTPAQQKWADAEIGVIIHFDLQVYEPTYSFRKDWNYHPDLAVFNPQELNTDQWIESAKAAGATYAVLVAKHCSGFSLWPTKAHDYSVKNTPWRNGKGDIVKDFIASCKRYGLKPGIYASTSANGYMKVDNPGKVVSGNPEEQQKYNEVVKTQLTELWSNYGELFEVWFDGGVLPVKQGGCDVLSMLKQHQPQAVAFQGPAEHGNNIRWVGNEEGVAPYPCWARADSMTSATGMEEIKGLNGNPQGAFWCPGEADFPLRKNAAFQGGWFWHKDQDDQLRSTGELMDRYVKSVGRNTNMLLGMVVDPRGLVPAADVKRLEDFGDEVKKQFGKSLGSAAGEGNLVTVSFNTPQAVRYVVIQEDIAKGERVREYNLYGMADGQWKRLSQGTSVGHKRIEVIANETLSGVKLEVVKADGTPQIARLACY